MPKKDTAEEILEVVAFIKDRVVKIEESMATKADIVNLTNRLDDELDKRGRLEARVTKLEAARG